MRPEGTMPGDLHVYSASVQMCSSVYYVAIPLLWSRPFPTGHTAVNFFQLGLQDFRPEPERYDIFWVQWCLMYLTDTDVLAWLARCAATMRAGGIIVVKENLSTGTSRATLGECRLQCCVAWHETTVQAHALSSGCETRMYFITDKIIPSLCGKFIKLQESGPSVADVTDSTG